MAKHDDCNLAVKDILKPGPIQTAAEVYAKYRQGTNKPPALDPSLMQALAEQYAAREMTPAEELEGTIRAIDGQIANRLAAKEVLEHLLAQLNIGAFSADKRARQIFERAIRVAMKDVQSSL